jgi:hypothetical protein
MVKIFLEIQENGKMRPAETILGMEGGGIKENNGRVELNYDIF